MELKKDKKRRAKAKKVTNLFDSKEQHPIIEFKPEDDADASLTPSFVLEVCMTIQTVSQAINLK